MVTWVVFLSLGLIIGMVAGVYFGQLDAFKTKKREELQAKLDATEKELSAYKMEVTEHFLVTASLVNSMTESYQAVHEHLAKGANRLCDSTVNVNRLSVLSNQRLADAGTEVEKTMLEVEEGSIGPVESITTLDNGQDQSPPATHPVQQDSSDDLKENRKEGKEQPQNLPSTSEQEIDTEAKPKGEDNPKSVQAGKNSAAQSSFKPDGTNNKKEIATEKLETASVEPVQPPSTPESLSFEDDETIPDRTVH